MQNNRSNSEKRGESALLSGKRMKRTASGAPGRQRALSMLPTLALAVILPIALGIHPAWGEAPAASFHHVHLNTTDAVQAAQWYEEKLEGNRGLFRGRWQATLFGEISLVFFQVREGFEGSEGSAVDHIAFAFRDVSTKLERLREMDVTVLDSVRDRDGLRSALIEDPWGTKIELVEDSESNGLHHVHLVAPSPDKTVEWYQRIFGGERSSPAGLPKSIRFGSMRLFVSQAEGKLAPTAGRSIDHISWGVPDVNVEAPKMKQKGAKFTRGPMKFFETIVAFVQGPDGVQAEIVHLLSDKVEG